MTGRDRAVGEGVDQHGEEGDAWFINRIRHGYTQNGITKMPAFEGILSQEAMWAIRTYLDSRFQGQ